MISSSRIVVAVGSGYLLGRTKKLRFALVIGGAVTGRQIPTSAIELLRNGVRFVATAPELAPLREVVRGPLLAAGTAAGTAAANYQMETLTRRLTAVLDTLQESSTAVIAFPPADDPAASGTETVVVEGTLTADDDAPATRSTDLVDEGVPA